MAVVQTRILTRKKPTWGGRESEVVGRRGVGGPRLSHRTPAGSQVRTSKKQTVITQQDSQHIIWKFSKNRQTFCLAHGEWHTLNFHRQL
jgi:hypothetical protein